MYERVFLLLGKENPLEYRESPFNQGCEWYWSPQAPDENNLPEYMIEDYRSSPDNLRMTFDNYQPSTFEGHN